MKTVVTRLIVAIVLSAAAWLSWSEARLAARVPLLGRKRHGPPAVEGDQVKSPDHGGEAGRGQAAAVQGGRGAEAGGARGEEAAEGVCVRGEACG